MGAKLERLGLVASMYIGFVCKCLLAQEEAVYLGLQSTDGHGEKVKASASDRRLWCGIKSASMFKARRVGEVKFRPVQAGGHPDILLYKGDIPLSRWPPRWRRRDSARVPPALGGGRARARASRSRRQLLNPPKQFLTASEKRWVPVHVHVRAVTNFCEPVLR